MNDPITYIYCIAVLQCVIFILIRKSITFIPQILITLLLCFLFFSIIPNFFIHNQDFNEMQCGLPLMVIHLVFWIFGPSSVTFIFLVFLMLRNIRKVDDVIENKGD